MHNECVFRICTLLSLAKSWVHDQGILARYTNGTGHMTNDIKRIRRSWAKAASDPAAMTRYFYTRLFTIAPDVEPLFQSDMDAQGEKLAETLAFVVDHIDDPDELLPAARDLAIRHVSYGATAAHYDAVGAALLDTFQDLLGNAFSPEDHAAWAGAYAGLAEHMIHSAGYTKG